jgi:hypothetical protein
MKYLSKYGSDAYKASLMQPGALHNKEVNSVDFKRKRLINNGYNCEGVPDLDIPTLFSEMQSDWRKSCKKRKKEILQRVSTWEPEYVELVKLVIGRQDSIEEWLETLTDESVHYYWTRIHGISTIRNWANVKKTRKTLFKQTRISGFKFNTGNQESVFLKSGLEQKYVEFFEKMKIPWCYELIKIETTDCSGFYIPDFLIEIGGKQIVLEVKGDFYNQPYNEYYQNKILAGIKFCKIHNYRYVLTQKNPDVQYNFLTSALIDTEKENVRN